MPEQFYDEEMTLKQERLASTPDMVAQRRALIACLSLKTGEHVLDVGSGNGILARDLKSVVGPAGKICGVDSAKAMIEMARRLCPEAEFHLGDATDLPLDNECFDAVTASQLLCFVKDPDKALQEFHRVLVPGGRVVILDSDWGSLVWNCRNRELMSRAITLYTTPYADASVPRTLSRRLEKSGFTITDRRSFVVLNWSAEPNTYAGQTTAFMESMMKASDDFTDADWSEWSKNQRDVADAGEFMFSLNRYVFSAKKNA